MKLIYRRIGIIGSIVFLFGAVILTQVMSKQKESPAKVSNVEKPVRTVNVYTLEQDAVQISIPVQGRLMAYDKVDVFAEVSGTLLPTNVRFKEGVRFRKGDLLLKIDDEEARLSLLSQRSTLLNNIARMMPDLRIDFPESFPYWEKYLEEYDVKNSLQTFPEPKSKREKLFLTARELYSQYYNIKSAEARLDKYSIRAPFSGVITQSNVNPGTLIRVGQQAGTLMNTGIYELEASLPVGELKYIHPGDKVRLHSVDINESWMGKIQRISDQIDPATQTVKIFIRLSGQHLREGMYISGTVQGETIENVHAIPKEILVDQKKVWILRDSALFSHSVELIKSMKDTAIVKGLENGMILPKSQLLGTYEGMKVHAVLDSTDSSVESATNSALK